MKIFTIIFILLQIQTDSLVNQQNTTLDTSVYHTYVETVKVFGTGTKNQSTKETYRNELNYFDKLISETTHIGWKVLIALLILILMGYLNYQLNRFYNRYNLSSKFKNADLVKLITHLLIWITTIFLIIYTLLKSSSLLILLFLVFVFIVTIISLSDLAKNVVGGILILIDKPFEYGDWIKIGDYVGRVHSKNLRNTEIITEDDSLIRIPNSYFTTFPFENLNVISKNKQVTFVVEVPPRAEISNIKTSIQEMVALSIFNSIDKPVEVIFKGINERGNLSFQIKAFVFDARYESEFKSEVQQTITEIFGLVR